MGAHRRAQVLCAGRATPSSRSSRAVVSRDPASASNLEPRGAEQQEARVRALPDEVTQQRLHFVYNPPDVASSAIGAAPGGHDDALLHSTLK